MRTVWITDEPMPASIQTIEAALAAGAGEILHGIPPGLADLIPAGATGLVDLDDEPSETAAARWFRIAVRTAGSARRTPRSAGDTVTDPARAFLNHGNVAGASGRVGFRYLI